MLNIIKGWIFCLLLMLPLSMTSVAAEGNLKIVVNKIESDQGQLFLRVYNQPEKWLSDDFVVEKSYKVASLLKDNSVVLSLTLPQGEYALSVFHDLDNDGEVKRNYMGMPAEPVVMSNNAPPMFGPPKYKAAKFILGDKPVVQELDLN